MHVAVFSKFCKQMNCNVSYVSIGIVINVGRCICIKKKFLKKKKVKKITVDVSRAVRMDVN